MFNNKYNKVFPMFSIYHLILLVILLTAVFILYKFKDKFTEKSDKVFRLSLGITMLTLELIYWIWQISTNTFELKTMIPLGLCAMTMWLTSIALISNNFKIIKVILPWSFVGAFLSFIVVDLNYVFSHFRFFHYIVNHLLFFLGNLYFLFTKKIKYTYKDLNKSTITLIIVATLVLIINFIIDTNHMFLRRLPDGVDEMLAFLFFPFNTIFLVFGIYLLFQIFYLSFIRNKKYLNY